MAAPASTVQAVEKGSSAHRNVGGSRGTVASASAAPIRRATCLTVRRMHGEANAWAHLTAMHA